jgi:hypothetical protein
VHRNPDGYVVTIAGIALAAPQQWDRDSVASLSTRRRGGRRGNAEELRVFSALSPCSPRLRVERMLRVPVTWHRSLVAAVCFAGFAFVWAGVRQTKGKSLEQIERELA